MLDGRDGPNVGPIAVSVTTTAVEAKVGASRLDERSVIAIQALDADVYYGFSNSVTSSTGFVIPEGVYAELAFGDKVEVWLVAVSGSVDVRIAEIS
mgnify:CR=1 FL=1